jgi:sterol 3beta-glucosyltransferase
VRVTGYYFFPQNNSYQPPVELLSFLQAADPPICVTFGSMVHRDKERIDHVVRETLRQTGHRGIILSGWGGVRKPSSSNLLYFDAVPHDWLLPRCKIVIHHGGAGTTGSGLRAGIPNIVVPFMADQPFWGGRVSAISAGPRPILVKNLSVEKLATAIVEADREAFRIRARTIGQQIQNEDGIGNTVQWIEKYSNNFHRWY